MSVKIVKSINDIDSIDPLIAIIQRQLDSYGSSSDYEKIKNAVFNAVKPESRSVFFLKITKDNKLAGFAFANICSGLDSGADYLWLNELFVEEKFREQGIATKLLKFIEAYSKENNIKYFACSTGTGNAAAQSLYKKNGFNAENIVWCDKSLP